MWSRITPTKSKHNPPAIHCHSSISWNNNIYIFGGTNGKEKYNTVYMFDTTECCWAKLKTTGHQPSPRYCAAVGLYKECMIVFGGFDGSRTNSVYSLNLLTHVWTLLLPAPGSPVPMARSHHSLSIIGSSMYIFGGLSEDAKLMCDLHVFDLERLCWKSLQPSGTTPCGRLNHSSHVIGNFFLLFGGYDGKLRLNDLFLYNIETSTWVEPLIAGTPPSRRLGQASVVAGNKFIVFGGDDGNKDRELLNDLHILDLGAMKWFTPDITACFGEFPQGRTHASASVAYDDKIYLIDGCNSEKYKLDEIHRLDLSGLYEFQLLRFNKCSNSIIGSIADSWQKLQVMTNISNHISGIASRRQHSPPSKRRFENQNSNQIASSSSMGSISNNSTSIVHSGSASINVKETSPISFDKSNSFSGTPSSIDFDENTSLMIGVAEIRSQESKKKRGSQRTRDRPEKEKHANSEKSYDKSTLDRYDLREIREDDEYARPARSPKRSRKHKSISRSSSRRDLSPSPLPTSPNELSPATSPRLRDDSWNFTTAMLDVYDGSNYARPDAVVTFAEPHLDSTDEEIDDPLVVQVVRKTLNLIRNNFDALSVEKGVFMQQRQVRLGLIAEEGYRNQYQATELQGLKQQQKEKVILNVGGTLFTTSKTTLTKFPESMLAAMFSGRHPLVPEEDGTYFIDRDGTYFRYILNYLRCGDEVVLQAKPSHLMELLNEARFFQLEGLREAIQAILADPDLREEPIVEY